MGISSNLVSQVGKQMEVIGSMIQVAYDMDKDLESKETAYKIPEPKEKNETKNVLEYINENEE